MTVAQGEEMQNLQLIRLAAYIQRREAEEAGNYMIPDDDEV